MVNWLVVTLDTLNFGEDFSEKGGDIYHIYIYMDVSKNRDTPKWMVKIMENPIKIDDLGVPLFLETPIYIYII